MWRIPFSIGPFRVDGISASELNKRLNEEESAKKTIILVDVRDKWEYDRGHIEGAVNMPIARLQYEPVKKLVESKQSNTENVEIVCICLSAHRSPPAVRWLTKNGFKNVKQLDYGMLGWFANKYPTVKP